MHQPLTLSQRCALHADKMQDEGWYTTANVLAQASQTLASAPRAYAACLTPIERLSAPMPSPCPYVGERNPWGSKEQRYMTWLHARDARSRVADTSARATWPTMCGGHIMSSDTSAPV